VLRGVTDLGFTLGHGAVVDRRPVLVGHSNLGACRAKWWPRASPLPPDAPDEGVARVSNPRGS
jgi:hypothetical protein